MKKIICIILSLIMLFSFAACKGTGDTEETTLSQEETTQSEQETEKTSSNARTSFILPYSEADSLSPFKAQTQINRAITTLLYDSLYTLDESFMPSAVLAKTSEIGSETVEVTLSGTAKFSDSSELNATDVVYSFNQAKESDRYSALLSGIDSAAATDRYKIRFNLSQPDAFVLSVLTFPIIKYGSAEQNVPTGSGRYVFSTDKLSYNKSHISGEKPKIKTIGLFSLNDRTNFVDALQIGNISFIFRDLSDCEIQRAVARSVPLTLNNLIFIGVNSKSGALKDKALRQAINLAVDKDAIVSQDFQSYAVRTESPFNPKWGETKEQDSVFDQSEAVEILEKNGYTYSSQTDKYRRDTDGKTLYFKILVCEENEFRASAAKSVAKYLSQIGIYTEVEEVSYKKYKEKIKEKDFDLYIGEIKLCENMSLSPFFSKSGKAHYGVDLDSEITASYKEMLQQKKSVSVFESDFSKEMPFIPLCYRQGIVMTSNTLSDNIKSVPTDLFANIYEWKMN